MHILNIQFNLNDNINKFSTKLMKLIRLVFKANESTERKIVYDLLFLSEVFELGEYEKRDLLKKYSSDIVEAIDEYTDKKASFLADVVTVSVGCELIDDPNCWSTYDLDDEPLVKYVSNKVPKSSYVSANFVSGIGKFRDILN